MDKKEFIALIRQTIVKEEESATMFELEWFTFLRNLNRLLDSMEEE